MSGIRSAVALRRLYERYRTATTLRTSGRRPGEWLTVAPGSEEATALEAAFRIGPDMPGADEELKAVALLPLNGALGVTHEMDVRLVSYRTAGSTSVFVRFVLVPHGRKLRGWVPPARSALPASGGETLALDLGDPVSRTNPVSRLSNPIIATSDSNVESTDGDATETPLVLPDGSPIPDLSMMLMDHELADLWRDGKLNDLDTMDALFNSFAHLVSDVVEEDDIALMMEGIRTNAVLASSAPAIAPLESAEARAWHDVANGTVNETIGGLRGYRFRNETGRLFILAPSPGTGKSRGMMQAAAEEQEARRKVGYAVLSRAQIPEAAERLKASGQFVRLIVIEGRHPGNCDYMDQVQVATAAGFSPGSTVCPSCPMYPGFGFSKHGTCGYYGARIEAARDRFMANLQRRASAIILTTHASAIQGSHIMGKRLQGFWDFDSLFIDEDPTSSLIQLREITEDSLVYSNKDSRGNFDGPTLGTRVLRDAMGVARRQREEAAERGWLGRDGNQDRIHNRDHGSTYAGADLQALLEPIARSYQMTLAGLAVAVVDGMTERPPKGEIMSMDAAAVAAKYPNRHLASFYQTISNELSAVAEARAAGIDLEPAYRAHLDLNLGDDDTMVAVARVHELRGYSNPRTNIVIGDAYANVEHYEGLFDRYRNKGVVDVIQHRALWPTSSTLVRIVTHAGSRQVGNPTQFRDHLDTKVWPLLELERGRRVLFYLHMALKKELEEWLETVRDELEMGEYAIEHWGGGRGKDTYKDFDTFIGVTEYIPNVGALIHEANTVAALAAPGNTRVAHWNGFSERKGSMTFANSLSSASPYYQAAFQRKAVDELAQAVHRIRPAIPAAHGTQKRAYVIGHRVPWTDELVAATTATAVVDNGNDEPDLETEALGRGGRFSLLDTLGLVSVREIAGAIGTVLRTLGCWSHAFAHALLGVPSWSLAENLIIKASFPDGPEPMSPGLLKRSLSAAPSPDSPLVGRVLNPPLSWSSIGQRVSSTSNLYRTGLTRALEELRVESAGRLRLPWMPKGSHGYEFWGSGERFDQVLSGYAPEARKVPF